MYKVDLTLVEKQIKWLPEHVVVKLRKWAIQVELYGINEVRKIPGFHDEPLKGDRRGQRSIRLSISYRAIYSEYETGILVLIKVEEVSKHDY